MYGEESGTPPKENAAEEAQVATAGMKVAEQTRQTTAIESEMTEMTPVENHAAETKPAEADTQKTSPSKSIQGKRAKTRSQTSSQVQVLTSEQVRYLQKRQKRGQF